MSLVFRMSRAAAALLLTASLAGAADYRRVVSIGGDVTEIVFALGAGNLLVARDSTSTYPDAARALPDAGYMRALSAEGVLGMHPDAILASAGSGPPEQLAALEKAGLPIARIGDGHDADAIAAKIMTVGTFLGRTAEAETLAARVRADLATAAAAADRPTAERRRVLFILSMNDGKVIAAGRGTSAEAMITLAGGINATPEFNGFKAVSAEALLSARPDVILLMDRGQHAAAVNDLTTNPMLASTPAVKNGRVIRMDGLYLLGFGPRTARAIADLSASIYGGKP